MIGFLNGTKILELSPTINKPFFFKFFLIESIILRGSWQLHRVHDKDEISNFLIVLNLFMFKSSIVDSITSGKFIFSFRNLFFIKEIFKFDISEP